MLDALAMASATPSAEASTQPQGWAVVVTHPQAERWACANLNQAGYRTYLPLYAARRRDPVLRTLTRIVERPLFPGYLFVHHAEHDPWIPIWHAPGVRELIVDADRKPQYARAGDISALQAGNELRRTPTPAGAAWPPGTPCSLATGVFKGHPAVVDQVSGQNARITLMLLGALRSVYVPVECLAPRDE